MQWVYLRHLIDIKEGCVTNSDDSRSGWLSTSRYNEMVFKVRKILRSDRQIRELSSECYISYRSYRFI